MNHRITIRQNLIVGGLIILSLTGCKYDRSFMNFDSNSGSPFLGFQLAVDSGSRPPKPGEHTEHELRSPEQRRQSWSLPRLPKVPERGQSVSGSEPPILFARSATRTKPGFVTTSESRDLNTDIRYSLQSPVSDASLRTESIDLRLSAF